MIRVTVSARHMSLSDTLKSYANEKSDKLERYYDRLQSVQVVFDHQSVNHLCEIIATGDHHNTFVAKSEHEDPYAAFDASAKELERQLRRHKEKLRNRKHPEGPANREPLAETPAPSDIPSSRLEGEAP
ncbi:MAG: ribosome hibernation-promoting factor, HPF/YfiA family [Phycisphaerae bacterium]